MALTLDKLRQKWGVPSNPNLLINGNLQQWRRGTSFQSAETTGGIVYTADRWGVFYYPGQSVYRFANNSPAGTRYALRAYRTAGANYVQIIHILEDNDIMGGKPYTLSFWARGYGGYTGYLTVRIGYIDHVVTLTGTWTKYTVTVGSWIVGTASLSRKGLSYYCSTEEGQGFDVTDIKLEPGFVATPTIYEDDVKTGLWCSKYYVPIAYDSVFTGTVNAAGTAAHIIVPTTTKMRVLPSIVGSPTWYVRYNGALYTATSAVPGLLNDGHVRIQLNLPSAVAGHGTCSVYVGAATGLDAEIYD